MSKRQQRQHKFRPTSKFIPLALVEELNLIKTDQEDFQQTKAYLRPLIDRALSHSKISSDRQEALTRLLLSDVELAAARFLTNYNPERTYSFADYFTWYIGERLSK